MCTTAQGVLKWLTTGHSTADILGDFPALQAERLQAALAYAADRERHTVWVQAA